MNNLVNLKEFKEYVPKSLIGFMLVNFFLVFWAFVHTDSLIES